MFQLTPDELGQLRIPNWHLKFWPRWSSLRTLRLHGARCGDSRERVEPREWVVRDGRRRSHRMAARPSSWSPKGA
jgi:hypothetical protein